VGSELPANSPREYLESLRNREDNHDIIHKIVDLYYSLLYSKYFSELIESPNSDDLSRTVYADLFNFSDADLEINELRKKIVFSTWDSTIKYVAEIASGRVAKPVEVVFPNSIRCDMHNIVERLTLYPVDRSTTLTAFHGTGYIDFNLRPNVRFRISLQNEGFSPVFGSLLGEDYENQPLFYFPNILPFGDIPLEIADNILIKK